MKRTLKFIGKTILFFLGFVVLYIVTALILSKIVIEKEESTNNTVTIYVLTNGVHSDIVVPVKNKEIDWSKEIKYTNVQKVDSTFNYLGMGWGDKEIFIDMPTWADLTVSQAFKASFGLSTTAIHTTYHKNLIENDTCIKMKINNDQYSRLVSFIKKSFKPDADGHFINIKTDANYGKTDAFYEAIGSYSLFHTCNSWTNKALKKSGQKHVLWTPFDKGIFSAYKDD